MKIWIAENEAFELVQSGEGVLFDCRGVMDNLEQSIQNYIDERVESAEYIHSFLSGNNTISGGRHPLPDLNDFADYVISISQGKKIIAYDNRNSFFGTRFVYLCHLVGLDCFLIQEGYEDLKLFKKTDKDPFVGKNHATVVFYECTTESYEMAKRNINKMKNRDLNIDYNKDIIAFCEDINALVNTPDINRVLIDARAHERFIGNIEPLDKVAGHIPTAINIPFSEMYEHGLPKHERDLKDIFKLVLGKECIVYCGSGLSATPLYVALKSLGENVRLYAGSYSEWSSKYPENIEIGD
ncbi:sulfurtransferase [Macrococcus equi]|uniref:sulfurtransferase n=1 Tax=Macrococcus equi TaxID=3395462 RepID=UPI0039BE824A